MKKSIMIAALTALTAGVSAQKPAAPAAKPAAPVAAKPAAPAAAPAAPAAAAKTADPKAAPVAPVVAPAPAAKHGAKITATIWGGYNISQRSDMLTAAEAYGSNSAPQSNAYDTSKNGLTGGFEGWYEIMDKLQVGLGVSYVRGFKTERTTRYSSGNIVNTTQFNYLPILLQARYFFMEGLYAGAGAGVAINLASKSDVTTTLPSTAITTIPYSDSYGNLGLWLEARLGYQIEIMDNIVLDAFGKFAYQISSVTFKDVDASGNLTSASVKNNGFFITPGLSVSMKF